MRRLFTLLLVFLFCVGSACAMTEDHARELVMKSIPGAKNAVNIAVFPSKTYDGAFAVVMDSYKDASFSAEYWYVTDDDKYLLGKGGNNKNFGLLDTDPEVFYNAYGIGTEWTTSACVLIDNVPVKIVNTNGIRDFVYSYPNVLEAVVSSQGNDYAFLHVDMSDAEAPVLVQICAKELNQKQFLAYNGAQKILNTVESAGYTIDKYLYWDKSAIALNCIRNGEPYHVYVYMDNGTLVLQGGWWGDDIGMLPGFASAIRNLDMDIIETK